jgi:tetratricopeptide (TPR) repeat protein
MSIPMKKKSAKPTLSACLIVKNEEKFLEQCLDSIKGVVDEIIIVDTGSTDNTVEIAKKWTRNHSINYATKDWILIIDADEKLEKDDIPILRRVLNRNEFNSIFFSVLSDLPSGISKNYSQRIFRRGKGYYDGIVHNQLVCEGQSLVTDMRIYHYGYNLDPEKMLKKFKRTEALLKDQVRENPTFGFVWMNITRIYKCQELWDDAIKTAEEALNTRREFLDATTYQMIMYDMAYSLFSKKEYDKAENACKDVLNSYPDNLDINFMAGSINICKKNYQEAIQNYSKYLQISEDGQKQSGFTSLIVDTYASQGQAWNNIGSAYAELGQLDIAIDSYLKAISYKKDLIYYENLARIYLKQNRIDDVIKTIKEADDLGIATDIMLSEILHNLAMINIRLLNRDKSLEYVHKILALGGVAPNQYMAMGNDWVNMKEYEFAMPFYEKCLQSDPKNSSALVNLATCYAELGMYESAIVGYRSALLANPKDPTIIRNLLIMKKKMESQINHTSGIPLC